MSKTDWIILIVVIVWLALSFLAYHDDMYNAPCSSFEHKTAIPGRCLEGLKN